MRLPHVFLLSLVTVLVVAPLHSQGADFDIWLWEVELRPGITVDIHVKVFVNEEHPCDDKTIVGLHGAWGGHVYYQAVAEELFQDNPTGRKVCRFASIDLPGHAGAPEVGSGLPTGGLLFGELTMEDYVTAYLAALSKLPEFGVHPKTLWGHSMGGLIVQMAEQRLLRLGTSLRREFNTKKVLLTAPVPPAPVPYPTGEQFAGLHNLFYLCFTGPGGSAIPASCPSWLDVEGDNDIDFADLDLLVFLSIGSGNLWDCDPATTPFGDPPLPAPQNCDSGPGLGDVSLFLPGLWTYRESMQAIFEFIGALQYQRPVVDAGVFGPASPTRLWVVTFEHDDPREAIYVHLTGDGSLEDHVLVTGANAVHDMPLISPREFLEAIAGAVSLP